MLLIHKPKCENNDKTPNRTSPDSHLHWKNPFHKSPLKFRIYADFEADNEIDNSSIGKKLTNILKQNPVLNGYRIESELEDVLKSGYYKTSSGSNNVNSFVDEILKLENKMVFYLKDTKKGIIMTAKNEEEYRNHNICRFCEKYIDSDKVRDHCYLTGKYRDPAHINCNINVTQD